MGGEFFRWKIQGSFLSEKPAVTVAHQLVVSMAYLCQHQYIIHVQVSGVCMTIESSVCEQLKWCGQWYTGIGYAYKVD